MDETQKQFEELKAGIHQRMASLDIPVRELLLSNEYIITLKEIIDAHSLDAGSAGILEEVTTNFLLGTVRPSELEQVYIESFSTLSKDQIHSLYNALKMKILNKVWEIVEKSWQEDDEREELFKEVVAMSEVPLPPNLQKEGVETVGQKFEKDIISKSTPTAPVAPALYKAPNPIAPTVPKENWDEKIEKISQNKPIETTNRIETDRTLPKINTSSIDPYREIPE